MSNGCSTCQGSGVIFTVAGHCTVTVICPVCNGKGKKITNW